jgi:hypothetical protein
MRSLGILEDRKLLLLLYCRKKAPYCSLSLLDGYSQENRFNRLISDGSLDGSGDKQHPNPYFDANVQA